MKDYSYLIDEICPSLKSQELIRKIIPILVNWAKHAKTDGTYRDLNVLLGYSDGRFSGIGYQLGLVSEVFRLLSGEIGVEIPTLNALVNNSKTGLPSEGFSYVFPDYDKYDDDKKKELVSLLNTKAIGFRNWDWVLSLLGLKPKTSLKEESIIRSGQLGMGGESDEHRKLKEYVAAHPEIVGLKKDEQGCMEYTLLSGDRLDVFFKDSNVAVEIKSEISSDADVLRGLFQCVKYKSILDAEAQVHGQKQNARAILLLGKSLSVSNRQVQTDLGIEVIEKIKNVE